MFNLLIQLKHSDMEITKAKNGLLLKSNGGGTLYVSKNGQLDSEADVVLGLSEATNFKAFNVDTPGEYEINGISIIAQSSNQESIPDIFELVVDEVLLLVIYPRFKYLDSIHRNIGDIDILILDMSTEADTEQFLTKFDPQILVPFNAAGELRQKIEKMGISNVNETSKLKAKPEQFDNEEFVLEAVILK